MIVHDGKHWVLRSDVFSHGTKRIVEVWRDGKQYYPDKVKSFGFGIFLDENSRFYDIYQGRLRIRDGFTGETLDASEPAYAISVQDGGRLAAVQLARGNRTDWKILLEDGGSCYISVPSELTSKIPYGQNSATAFGYSDGIIAMSYYYNSGFATSGLSLMAYAATFRASDGACLSGSTFRRPGMTYPYGRKAIPIGATTVGIFETLSTGDIFYQNPRQCYITVDTVTGAVTANPRMWSEWFTPPNSIETDFTFLGRDNVCFYGTGRMMAADGRTWLNEWVIARFSIAEYNGPEVVERHYDRRSYTEMNIFGNLRRQRTAGGAVYEIYNPILGRTRYDEDIGQKSRAYDFYENSVGIWYDDFYDKAELNE